MRRFCALLLEYLVKTLPCDVSSGSFPLTNYTVFEERCAFTHRLQPQVSDSGLVPFRENLLQTLYIVYVFVVFIDVSEANSLSVFRYKKV
jgi:hypothetical protein